MPLRNQAHLHLAIQSSHPKHLQCKFNEKKIKEIAKLAGTPVFLKMKTSGHKREKDFYKHIRITPQEAAQKTRQI